MSHLFSFLVVKAIGEVDIVVQQRGLGSSRRDDGHLDGLRVGFTCDRRGLHTVSLSSNRIFIFAAPCDCTASPADTILVM